MYLPLYVDSKNNATVSLPSTEAPSKNFSHFRFSIVTFRRKWKQIPRIVRFFLAFLLLVCLMYISYHYSMTWDAAFPSMDDLEDEEIVSESSMRSSLPFRPRPPIKYRPSSPDEKSQGIVDVSTSPSDEEKSTKSVPLWLSGEAGMMEALKKFSNLRHSARQMAVIEAMKHAWNGYKKCSWGKDHLRPISCEGEDWFGLGLTIIDGLDTLWLMGLKKEFDEAKQWVSDHLSFDVSKEVNLFETTIRVLGGLLSAYHLSQENAFLTKAIDLADRLLPAFRSKSGIPLSDVNLASRKAFKPRWSTDSSTSEVTTIQLEFRDLSMVTGNTIYADKVNAISEHVHTLTKLDGLVPIFISPDTGAFRPISTVTLGARGDSYYEYLLKQWIQMGHKETDLKNDFVEAVAGMEYHLGRRTKPNGYLFFGELQGSSKRFVSKMDELTCYLPGTLALGASHGLPEHHMKLAEDLMETCAQTWLKHDTKLAPEITYFNTEETADQDFTVHRNDAHYLLRPETIESLWYLFALTGDRKYQDWGWEMFQGIERYCKTENGYSVIGNVMNRDATAPRNKMESYFLAETLKYFFLLFSDDPHLLDTKAIVLNSEGHLLPVYNE